MYLWQQLDKIYSFTAFAKKIVISFYVPLFTHVLFYVILSISKLRCNFWESQNRWLNRDVTQRRGQSEHSWWKLETVCWNCAASVFWQQSFALSYFASTLQPILGRSLAAINNLSRLGNTRMKITSACHVHSRNVTILRHRKACNH